MNDLFSVSNQVAIVTGAGSGIGRASALALSQSGASVVCGDIDTKNAEITKSLSRISSQRDLHFLDLGQPT